MRDNIGKTLKAFGAILIVVNVALSISIFFILDMNDLLKILICLLSLFFGLLIAFIVCGISDIVNLLNYMWLKMNNEQVTVDEPFSASNKTGDDQEDEEENVEEDEEEKDEET